MPRFTVTLSLLLIAGWAARTLGDDAPLPTHRHQVTGLFAKERIGDLEQAVRKLSGVELVKVDFDRAEAEFRYDPKVAFVGTSPEQIVARFDQLLRDVSRYTFGIKPLCTTPREQLKFVEIPVLGLDCKACCLAAYESIFRLDGVEQATASFRERRVTAWIDPTKTDLDKLKQALKQRNVTLADDEAAKK